MSKSKNTFLGVELPHDTSLEKRGIYWRFFGVVTETEVEEANQEMYTDEKFDNIIYAIWDISEVEKLEMEVEEVELSAYSDLDASAYKRSLKIAFVASNSMTKNYCVHYINTSVNNHSPWEFQIFDTIEETRKWVDS